ncbi:uncharacterized protein LOC122282381 [Carya illinoinensis]|uniref:uncharacterized protein LOC122282381 n=1 Tax=Carya illinoinensis TaxID=32201 RepID=UPI001C71972A|nr:uncharacterized protein LOC122282381 [Carya illinoinensis]
MKLLSWNCRGLGNSRTVQTLGFLIKEKGPDFIFLIETKLAGSRARNIACRFKYDCCVVVDAMGRSGGLMLMWKNEVEYELLNYSNRHINGFVYSEETNSKWLLTCFYGDPVTSCRRASWQMLKSFKPASRGWCAIGDFNEILTMGDKVGGRDRGEAQMRMFREVVEEGQLFDLGWKGLKYTWCNRHEDSTFTKERIDRAFANRGWKSVYSESYVDVLPAICSDHCPLLLSFHYNRAREGWSPFQFKYDVSWSKEKGCKELVAAQWQKVTGERGKIQNAQHKLEDCSLKLK